MPAAANALMMNSYWNMSVAMSLFVRVAMTMPVVMHMRVALDVAAARQHENVPARAQHLDLGVVEPRQYRRRHYFVDGTEHGPAIAKIKHPVDGREQLIELVRGEQHRDLARAANLLNGVDDDFLMTSVEAD